MAAISKVGNPSLASMNLDPGAQKLPALTAGEALAAGDACYVKSDGLIYRSSGALTGLGPPDEPALTTATTGGTVAAGLHSVRITYVTAAGETLPSGESSIITTGATSTITVASPSAATGATAYKVYMAPPNGGPWKLQNAGGTAIGTPFVLSAPAVTNTAIPPSTDTSGSRAASKVRGFAPTTINIGEPVSLIFNISMNYGSGITPGIDVFLSGSVLGGLDTAASALGIAPIGFAEDATRIYLYQSRY